MKEASHVTVWHQRAPLTFEDIKETDVRSASQVRVLLCTAWPVVPLLVSVFYLYLVPAKPANYVSIL